MADEPQIQTLGDEQEEEITEEKTINEEYKIWKKNAPYLYDYMLSTALEWPTLTTQWFPDKQAIPDKDYSTHRLLLGTHTSLGMPNYLEIANVTIPNPTSPDAADYDEARDEIGGHGGGPAKKKPQVESKLTIIQKIHHPGEVNKARYQPQKPDLIATMCTDGRTLVWDRTKHSSMPKEEIEPQIELVGHAKEGYGLSWSRHDVGRLATGSEDTTVKVWDLQGGYTRGNPEVQALHTYTHHTKVVNDVQYHPKIPHMLGTVSDDLTTHILDTRAAPSAASVRRTDPDGHRDAINSIAFNGFSEFIFATGSADKSIGVWDLRNLSVKLHALEGHQDCVTSLEWHPMEEAVLGSASYDRRIIFWDLSKVGDEQSPEDAEDGPPELLFMHGGHTNRISDFSWNLSDPWVVCSAAEDNMAQVWKCSSAITGKDDEDIPMNELEA